MTSYKAAESKREEFRKYLEKAGVMDVLTKVLVGLYEEPEKPDDAVNYVKRLLNESEPGAEGDEASLKEEIKQLKEKINQLTEENEDLKAKLAGCEEKSPTSTSNAIVEENAMEEENPAVGTPEDKNP